MGCRPEVNGQSSILPLTDIVTGRQNTSRLKYVYFIVQLKVHFISMRFILNTGQWKLLPRKYIFRAHRQPSNFDHRPPEPYRGSSLLIHHCLAHSSPNWCRQQPPQSVDWSVQCPSSNVLLSFPILVSDPQPDMDCTTTIHLSLNIIVFLCTVDLNQERQVHKGSY